MMNVSTLTVLLVCLLCECAQAASFQWGWEKFPSRNKRSTPNRFSVVENWNSVCEEVCGADYGGPGCGAYCYAHTSLGHNSQTLNSAFREMCPILCDNNLGTTKCNCASAAVSTDITSSRNSLCSAACMWRSSLRLNGCSVCGNESVDTTSDSQTSTDENEGSTFSTESANATIPTVDDGTTIEGDSTIESGSTTEEISTVEGGTTTDVESTTEHSTIEEDSTTEEGSTTEETTTDSTTISSTTTTTIPTTTTTRSTTPATTTPNWESMCEALCRNGEGGSLCNCDIPPFF